MRARAVRRLTRTLRVALARQRAAAIGPDLSHRRTIVTQVLRAAAVRRAMADEMRAKKISRREALKLGQDYAAEIAANYSHVFVAIMARVLTWFWTRLYDGVELHQLRAAAEGRGRQRNRLRAVPPQPHRLPAAVLRDLLQRLRGAAHRGRHQSQHAGARAASSARAARSTCAAASRATRCTRWCS